MATRREILQTALLGAAALGSRAFADATAHKPLKILILGGTGFLGPHLVECARARGHTLTLFNRGKTNPQLFPDVEKLRGDRKDNLEALKGRKWDAVIDDTAYVPKLVTAVTDIVAKNVDHYLLVSSISVFDEVKPGADESAPVQKLANPDSTDVAKDYGALKAACEIAAERAMPGRVANVRPGLIVGPGDASDRFTYWPVRMDRGGEALAPGSGQDQVQFVDVRDLAAWMVHVVETRTVGTFLATGPAEKLTMQELLRACRKACAKPASLTWIDEQFLKEQKVEPWGDMPVWTGSESGFSRLDCSKARKAGLQFRSPETTAKDTLAWWKEQPASRREGKMKAGLSPEREKEVLALWKAKGGK